MSSNTNEKDSVNVLGIVKKTFSTIGSTLASLLMVGVITGCIVACVLTVYILQSMDAEDPITLDTIPMGFTSTIVALDENGAEIEIQKLYISENNRIPLEDLEEVSPYVIDALIAIEDKRFKEHNGVDWIRTVGAFANYFVPFMSGSDGGSTIHQQLVKNVTGDNDYRIDRKVREIFRALNLSQNYTHDQIMLAYLNVVSFGAGTNGIEAAANVYFDKSAKDLTLAQSAAIVGITKLPTKYNPLFNPEENKLRQGDVLFFMLEQEKITQEEFDAAWAEPLKFQDAAVMQTILKPTSYFVDHVIATVIQDLVDQKGMTPKEASKNLYVGGYKIYTTMDMKIQAHLEELYSTTANFPPINRTEYPESAAIVTDLNGAIKGLIGGIGNKTSSRGFNRATMAKRQPGSTLKPIGPYALAFEYNLITPSTIIEDSVVDQDKQWPKNYYPGYRGSMTVEYAIAQSVNTVAVKVAQKVTPASLFDFYYYDLNMTNLVDPTDIDIAPMALGAVTDGITPLELVGAYQMIANGGYFTPPYAYTRVVDSNGRTVLQPDTKPRQVISEDTAGLLNKMTQVVVSNGTGRPAKIPNMPTAGKTGTSDLDVDQWFVGFTPYYIANVWLGYDKPNTYNKYGNLVKNSVLYSPHPYPTPSLFNKVMAPIHEGLDPIPFIESPNVVQKQYCTITGNLATANCPTATTWYKSSNLPPVCNGAHSLPRATPNEQGDGETAGQGEGSSSTAGGGQSSEPSTGPTGEIIDSASLAD